MGGASGRELTPGHYSVQRAYARQLPTVKTLSRYVRRSAFGDVSLVGYKASADVVSKAVTLAVTVAAARVLPGAEFGLFALAMTTGWILSVGSDAGLPLYLARRVARRIASGPPVYADVAGVMRIRAILGAIAATVGLGLAFVIAPRAVLPFFVIVAAQLLNAVGETLAHAYRGMGRSDIESTLVVSQKSITAVAALGVLWVAPSLLLLSLALAIPPAVAGIVSWRVARRLFSTKGSGAFDASAYAATSNTPDPFAETANAPDPFVENPLAFAPVGLGIFLSALYFRCDVYFVERWHGVETVGTYNAAFRIVEALRLFPAAALAVWFPTLCRATSLGPLKQLTAWLAIGALPLLAVVYLAAAPMLDAVYGARFTEAAPALRILALALPLFFVNYALTHQVIGWDGQRAYLAITIAALITNLVGNVLLIPEGGMSGAATSTLMTELVVTTGCLCALAFQRGSLPRIAVTGESR
jgi:O-antigen/teichoic acid export membrane protein